MYPVAILLVGVAVGVAVSIGVDRVLQRTLVGLADATTGVAERLSSISFESRPLPSGSVVVELGERVGDIIASLAVRRSNDVRQADSIYVATFTAAFPIRVARSDSMYTGTVESVNPLVIRVGPSPPPAAAKPRGYLLVPGTDPIPVF
jgi:hypothetical protein